ncbi:hypothetical protein MPSEU_000639000 [Mayamaea pseudoterrestris]|nr:hypothetical protein MPSEU_000639000 [Mayamaea pseudoterrestris]
MPIENDFLSQASFDAALRRRLVSTALGGSPLQIVDGSTVLAYPASSEISSDHRRFVCPCEHGEELAPKTCDCLSLDELIGKVKQLKVAASETIYKTRTPIRAVNPAPVETRPSGSKIKHEEICASTETFGPQNVRETIVHSIS